MKAIKKTKAQLFQELKSFQGFNILNHKSVREAENLRELKKNLAYYHSMYECLGRQNGQIVNGIPGGRFFLGNIYFTNQGACKSHLKQLSAIASFMGYEINKLTW